MKKRKISNSKLSAFPCLETTLSSDSGYNKLELATLMAMQGLLSNPLVMEAYAQFKEKGYEYIAKESLKIANATLKQLDK